MSTHDWRERTDEGETRLMRARRATGGGGWLLSSRLKHEEFWQPHDPLTLEDLRSIRDVLWRKYQRKRIPWEFVSELDTLIEEYEKDAP